MEIYLSVVLIRRLKAMSHLQQSCATLLYNSVVQQYCTINSCCTTVLYNKISQYCCTILLYNNVVQQNAKTQNMFYQIRHGKSIEILYRRENTSQ